MELIYENDYMEVFFRDGPTHRTLVTFNGLGVYANGQKYWGQGIAERLDIRCIGIISRYETWFPVKTMREGLGVILPKLRGTVLVYGSSMGAYAAIKYSGALQAHTVLAFSPQATISPHDFPANTYAGFFKSSLHEGMRIEAADLGGDIYIFYDNHFVDDRHHVDMMPESMLIKHIPVQYLRHDTNTIVNRTEIISEIFSHSLAANLLAVKSIIRAAKRRSSATYFNLAIHCYEHGKFNWAQRAITRAEEMGFPESRLDGFYRGFASALERAGRPNDAIELLCAAVTRFPLLHALHATLGRLLKACGEYDRAATSLKSAIEIKANSPGVQASYIDTLITLNRFDDARRAVQKAIVDCPDDRNLPALATSILANW
jgi:hypothetical protein